MQLLNGSIFAVFLATPLLIQALPTQSPGIISHNISDSTTSEPSIRVDPATMKRATQSGERKIVLHAPPRDYRRIMHASSVQGDKYPNVMMERRGPLNIEPVNIGTKNIEPTRQEPTNREPTAGVTNKFKMMTAGMKGAARHNVPTSLLV